MDEARSGNLRSRGVGNPQVLCDERLHPTLIPHDFLRKALQWWLGVPRWPLFYWRVC